MAQSAPQNLPNAGHFYSNIAKPIEIDMQFIVDSSNAAGIRSLKSNGYVKQVFMHTSTTPASGSPNPAAGVVMIQLSGNYNKYINSFRGFIEKLSGSPSTSTTSQQLSVISALGTATLAQWQAKGLPQGVTPAVGVAFIATASGAIGGSASVDTPVVSGIQAMEIVGDPALNNNSNVSANGGMYIYAQMLGATDASTTTMIPTAPADGSVATISIKLDGSSVTVDGL